MSHCVSSIDRTSGECFRSFLALEGARPLDERGIDGVVTPVPLTFFNGVASAALGEEEAEAIVTRVVETFRAERRAFRWWVPPAMRWLIPLLSARGMRYTFDSTGMTADLTSLDLEPPPIERIAIRHIENGDGLRDWAAVFMEGFHRPPEEAEAWVTTYDRLGYDRAWRHFVAYDDGVPVATTSLMVAGAYAGVYHVVTLPQARNRGVGAAVTMEAMRHAREAGATTAMLQSSEMGYRVYQRVGFEYCCELVMYDWKPEYETATVAGP